MSHDIVSTHNPRTRWRQFSLRFLLGMVMVMAVLMGILVNDARHQKSAIASITQVDGYYYYGFQYDGERYSQRECPPGPNWLWKRVDLSYVSNVVAVGLGCKPATDETLEHIAHLPHLQVLDLTDSLVSDRGLKHLGGLTSLKFLRLDGTNVTDVGLAELRHLTNLETLDIQRTKISEKGLVNIDRMKRLKELYLSTGQFSPEAIRRVQASLPRCSILTFENDSDE